MRTLLLVFLGLVLCIALQIGGSVFQKIRYPLGAVTNLDCPLIEVVGEHEQANQRFQLRKGEMKLLPYGTYKVTIPDGKGSFVLFKNNRGVCNISWASSSTSTNGCFVVAVNENANVSELSADGSVSGL
ncbi:hypothetical protein BH09VER1_BH09VER1_34030 [soil metagenome]